MKVLSVKQPWAALLVNGIKDIENRTRRTTFRGRILIHASSAKMSGSIADYLNQSQTMAMMNSQVDVDKLRETLKTGHIIGSVEIYDCVKDDDSVWAENSVWNWKVRNPVLFNKPIRAKGKLGLWDFTEETEGSNL